MIVFDSNVWIFAVDDLRPEHAEAKRRLAQAVAADDLLLPAVVQMEVAHYLSRYGVNAQPLLDQFFDQPGLRQAMDEGALREAAPLVLAERPAIGTRDALLLIHCKQTGARLVTQDKALAKVARRHKIDVEPF